MAEINMPLGVVGGGQHNYFKTRDMGKKRLQALGVLRSLTPAASNNESHHHRDVRQPVKHVMPFGTVVHELIHGEQPEIYALMHPDRPQPDSAAPIQMPVMPCSDSGMLKTRCGPKRSRNSAVVPKIALGSGTRRRG
jgi:hypothetical protein